MTAAVPARLTSDLITNGPITSICTGINNMGMDTEKKSYMLTYFDIKGRGEPLRMLFAIAKVPYADKRIKYSEWPELKQSTPYGQLPTLEISSSGNKSFTICQTYTIARYLAKEFDLAGKNLQEQVKADEITEVMRDAIQPITAIFNEQDETIKATVLKKYREIELPKFLNYLVKQLQSEWFLDEVSLADVNIYSAFDNIKMFVPNFLESKAYWKLRDWMERFESHPQINEWLSTRPITPY